MSVSRSELLGLVFLAALLMGCAQSAPTPSAQPAADEQPKYGGILRNLLDRDPGSCDQSINPGGDRVSANACGGMSNGLVRMQTGDGIEADLAERWDISADGIQWTFYLRKDVKWHDGEPFTADDVVYNFNRWIKPPKGVALSRIKVLQNYLDSAEKVDDYTVRLFMKYPPASFMGFIAVNHGFLYPKHILEALDPQTMTSMKSVIGTGPFKFKQEIRGSTYEMVRNPNYFRAGLPYLEGVRFTVLPDPSTRLAAMVTNQVDVYSGAEVPPEDAKTLREGAKKERIEVLPLYNLLAQFAQINTLSPPFTDPKVREAVFRVLDQREAIRVLALGEGIPGFRMAPYGAWSLPKEELDKLPGMGPRDQEIAKAKQLLAEAGYPDGFAIEKPLVTRNVTQDENLGVWVAQRLSLIGIKAQTRALESAALGQVMANKDFQIRPIYQSQALDDPDEALQAFTCNHLDNYTYWCDKEYDALFLKQSGTIDTAKRKEIVLDLQRRLLQTLAYIPLMWNVYTVAQWDYVRGWDPHSTSKWCPCMYVFDTAWLAK